MKLNAYISSSTLVLGLGATVAGAAQAQLPTYTAVYEVTKEGRDVGSSEYSLSYDAARDVYTFVSRTQARGVLRLAAPNPVVERSDFAVREGRIEPLEFWYEDGSRKGEDNYHAAFDWSASTVRIDGARRMELPLAPGVLDRGSMQVAVMRDMAVAGPLGPYVLADEDALKTYDYTLEGEDVIPTPVGELPAQRYRYQRRGSSRSTLLWAAPQLQYLPVRMEQFRDGASDTVFVLQSVAGLGAAP